MDLMNGLPSIIVGLFIFGLLVNHHHDSANAGSIALANIMLPLIARGSQEIPSSCVRGNRSCAKQPTALGGEPLVAHGMLDVVICPPRFGGIVTSTVLSRWPAPLERPRRCCSTSDSIFNASVSLQPQHRRSGAEHSHDDLLALQRS